MTIAAEIHAALIEAGNAVGTGPLLCTLKRAGDKARGENGLPILDADGLPTTSTELFELVAVQEYHQHKDSAGTLIGEQTRKITVNATGEEPLKSDTIAIGVAMADVVADTEFEEIRKVTPVAPAGVALMYELELAT